MLLLLAHVRQVKFNGETSCSGPWHHNHIGHVLSAIVLFSVPFGTMNVIAVLCDTLKFLVVLRVIQPFFPAMAAITLQALLT